MSEYSFNCPDCGLFLVTEDKELYEKLLKVHGEYENE